MDLRAALEIVRWRSSIGAPILTVVGQIPNLAGHEHEVAAAAISSAAMMAFAQVYNDIIDEPLDTKHKPTRPIPSGRISRKTARHLAASFALISTVSAGLAGLFTFGMSITCIALAVAYSAVTKNSILWGNANVALVSSLSLIYGCNLEYGVTASQLVGCGAIFIFIIGNELYKTALDAAGDAEQQLLTIATRYGVDTTGRVIGCCAMLLAAPLILAYTQGLADLVWLITSFAIVLVPVGISGFVASTKTLTRERLILAHRLWRAAWTPGIAVIVVLLLV